MSPRGSQRAANEALWRSRLVAELEALEAERDCLVLELDRVRAALDGNEP